MAASKEGLVGLVAQLAYTSANRVGGRSLVTVTAFR